MKSPKLSLLAIFGFVTLVLMGSLLLSFNKIDAFSTGDISGVNVINNPGDVDGADDPVNRGYNDLGGSGWTGGGGGTTTPTTKNYTLDISVTSGTTSGSVHWSPYGFLDGCASHCTTPIPSGTYETFTASPYSGYTFTGWGGDCARYGTGTCYLTMNSNKTVSASFGNSSESVNKSSVIVYVAETPGPTGIITAEKEGCLIDEGNNTCDIRFDWQTNNPVNTSSVTRSPESGFTIQNANSGENVSLPVTYGGSTFYLYNSEIELSNVSVDAECISGTTWVSSQNKCIKDVSVKSFSTPSCQIEVGKSSCNSEISWEVIGGYGDFSVTTPTNIVVGTGKIGTKSYTVEYPSRGFYLYNNSDKISTSIAYADCVSGSTWSSIENKCIKDVSVNKFNTPSCNIEIGENSCSTEVSWEVIGGYGDFSVTTPTNITVATGKSGTKSYAVQYPSRDFYLYNNGKELAKSTSYADCVEGTLWSMGEKKCISVLPPEPPIIDPVCPSGTIWDELQKKCVTKGHDCPLGTIWDELQKKCVTKGHDCPLGTTWSETQKACLCDNGATNPPECNLFGTLSKFEVKDCSIKSNESSCQTKLNWTSTLLGSFAITTPEQITVSTASSGTDVPYTVEYPSRKFFAYNNGNLVEEKTSYAKCEDGSIWSTVENKCVPGLLCAGDLERDVYLDCPAGYEGKIIRKQIKTYPECIFPEPVTEENSILINNTCKSKDGDFDPMWIRTCDECTEGVAQVRCVEKNENGDVRDFVMNCPGDTDGNGGGSGNSVLNITLKATPEKIMKGRLSTITWSSSADSCRAIPVPGYLDDFYTGEKNRPSGFDTVKPLSNNIYKIECTKGEVTESQTVEVKVGSVNIIEM